MSIRGGGESERGRERERDCEREGERERECAARFSNICSILKNILLLYFIVNYSPRPEGTAVG